MTNNSIIYVVLLLSLVISAVCTIMMNNILKAAIWLSGCSAILTVIMYLMGATLAAVLELSVCAGLITAIFVSTISMTEVETTEEFALKRVSRFRRYIFLPFILVAVGIGVYMLWPNLPMSVAAATAGSDTSVKTLLWDSHQLDIFGQILVVLAGVFSVVVLFRSRTVNK